MIYAARLLALVAAFTRGQRPPEALLADAQRVRRETRATNPGPGRLPGMAHGAFGQTWEQARAHLDAAETKRFRRRYKALRDADATSVGSDAAAWRIAARTRRRGRTIKWIGASDARTQHTNPAIRAVEMGTLLGAGQVAFPHTLIPDEPTRTRLPTEIPLARRWLGQAESGPLDEEIALASGDDPSAD